MIEEKTKDTQTSAYESVVEEIKSSCKIAAIECPYCVEQWELALYAKSLFEAYMAFKGDEVRRKADKIAERERKRLKRLNRLA